MAEYIERETLLKKMHGLHSVPNFQGHQTDEDILFQTMVDVVQEQPAINIEEAKHGHWIILDSCDYKCSECGFRFTSADDISMFKYCRCGAKMKEEV